MFDSIHNGLVFPEDILNEIWLMVGLESLESLHNCRQVCKIWNELIRRNIWESPSSRNIIAIRIQRNWGPGMIPSSKEISYAFSYAKWLESIGILPTDMIESLVERVKGRLDEGSVQHNCLLPEIIIAASLAHHGMLSSVRILELDNVDLSSVPPEHLASLASCVTSGVIIINVSNCDIMRLLHSSVKCKWLSINSQSLNSDETQAMVRIMESNVETVHLGIFGDAVTLDFMALNQYSGQGKCKLLDWAGFAGFADAYREEVRSWAQRIDWSVTFDFWNSMTIESI